MFNANNRYSLYNSRYSKTSELYGTSMAAYLIMRVGLFPKSVFERRGLFSKGVLFGSGDLINHLRNYCLLRRNRWKIKQATFEIMKSC